MPHNYTDVGSLEELRESGDYGRIASLLGDSWRTGSDFDHDAVRRRLIAAELAGRDGRIEDMEAALEPYLQRVDSVPFALAARVLLMTALYHYRRNEPSEALRLASLAETVASVRDDEFTQGEAIQLRGQALWSLERWAEAAVCFEAAAEAFADGSRSYWLGVCYLCLGAVRSRMGAVEGARTILERGIKILLKSHDDYNLAVARVNVAAALNVLGEHDTAHKYLLFAHDTFERIGHEQYTYLTLNSIAATLVWLKDYDRAETYVGRAIEMCVRVRSTQIASTYEIKARVHLARREWDKAHRALVTASDIAEQANSQSQMADVRRTLGKYYILQEKDDEAAAVLWEALDIARDLSASLLELEIKALLSQAVCASDPVEACRLLSDVETSLGARPLTELRKEVQVARRRINALDQEQYFVLSDAKIPQLADAKISLLKWLWARALHRARGNARDAAGILGVTPTYIRKLTKVIPRDLLRPGKKRSKKESHRL
jgi:tetratricopeptide (TPR) repeat protein